MQSYEQPGSSVLKIMKHLRNSNENYYRRKKKKNNHAFAFSFLFQCKSEEYGSKRTKVTSPFFSPYVANKSMLFDPNGDTIQTVISVECKLFI